MAGDMAANVGARIRQGRKARGWTQRQLASALGLAPPPDTQRISEWERGQHMPSEATLVRIAAALDRPVSWFYEIESEAPDLVAAFEDEEAQLARIEAKVDQALAAQAEIQEALARLTREPDSKRVRRVSASAAARAKRQRPTAPEDRDDRPAEGRGS